MEGKRKTTERNLNETGLIRTEYLLFFKPERHMYLKRFEKFGFVLAKELIKLKCRDFPFLTLQPTCVLILENNLPIRI